jgi:hypothetical protein
MEDEVRNFLVSKDIPPVVPFYIYVNETHRTRSKTNS